MPSEEYPGPRSARVMNFEGPVARGLLPPAELLWAYFANSGAQPKHVTELTDLGEFRTEGRALAAFLFWGRGLILQGIRPACRVHGTGHGSCLC